MDREHRLKRLRFRAWHRGTKEADLLIGGFFDAHAADWSDDQIAWFETLLEEQDVDIMGWAIGSIAVPAHFRGPMMTQMKAVGYVQVAE
ncbi:antitoxin CptB [Hephaestia caeni]|uniref:FAD assembly factor SdhE n=1 Tax=Hephaestia caeni TaxID=645617 RepID=A0A397P930_9SPHN|nr:succinate dehydrogenase assembly factor 2 [Hephaestia caeni]RIA46086.1 antitoxin CptB [Hephaestia caeni]